MQNKGRNRSAGINVHLELRSSVQPALVLAEVLPVFGFPDNLIDSLQDPSTTGLSALK